MTVIKEFDQLWCAPQLLKQFPGYRRCRKCRLCHPKDIRGCPTKDLAWDIEVLRELGKMKSPIYDQELVKTDQRVGEFLRCIEYCGPAWLKYAGQVLHVSPTELSRVWRAAGGKTKKEIKTAELKEDSITS